MQSLIINSHTALAVRDPSASSYGWQHAHWQLLMQYLLTLQRSVILIVNDAHCKCVLQKGIECKRQWYEEQLQRGNEAREADAVKHARQQELLQASKDTLQKQLATTETEFRLALQVCSTHAAWYDARTVSDIPLQYPAQVTGVCGVYRVCLMLSIWSILDWLKKVKQVCT